MVNAKNFAALGKFLAHDFMSCDAGNKQLCFEGINSLATIQDEIEEKNAELKSVQSTISRKFVNYLKEIC